MDGYPLTYRRLESICPRLEIDHNKMLHTDGIVELNGHQMNQVHGNGMHIPIKRKGILHIETCLKPSCVIPYDIIRKELEKYLRNNFPYPILNSTIDSYTLNEIVPCSISNSIDSIKICEVRGFLKNEHSLTTIDINLINLNIHVFHVSDDLGLIEMSPGNENEHDIQLAHHLLLPSRSLFGTWESLIFEDDLCTRLLDYVYGALLFGDHGIDSNIISLNRVVLLHGPPGTGKTTLCRSLAQKIAIRMQNRYSYGKLIEINSHSLFSKFFSESGKLVSKLFDGIHQTLETESDVFICILIDEVESLSAARKAALNGMEPSDSVRVVNALLTQLDKLKTKSNVLVLTTSNITDAIDPAFIDRADIKQYVGEPTPKAKYAILESCINELQDKGLILTNDNENLINWREIDSSLSFINSNELSNRLLKISIKSENMSGRTLRKLPFLAYAYNIRKESCNLMEFLNALDYQIDLEIENKNKMIE